MRRNGGVATTSFAPWPNEAMSQGGTSTGVAANTAAALAATAVMVAQQPLSRGMNAA